MIIVLSILLHLHFCCSKCATFSLLLCKHDKPYFPSPPTPSHCCAHQLRLSTYESETSKMSSPSSSPQFSPSLSADSLVYASPTSTNGSLPYTTTATRCQHHPHSSIHPHPPLRLRDYDLAVPEGDSMAGLHVHGFVAMVATIRILMIDNFTMAYFN